ncbi:MAG: hypothetical protein ABIW76_07470 [Fibrobacteria bacterium]
MTFQQTQTLTLIIGLTLVSGIADAQGFIHAASIWQDGRPVWRELGKSALGFTVGISSYWLSIRFMRELGVIAPEMQTLIWFGVTLVGVGVVTGRAFRWPLLDQVVGVMVLAGIGWLLVRTGT